jgi:hypothetical protein
MAGENRLGVAMASGIYILNIQGSGFSQSVKLVKLD